MDLILSSSHFMLDSSLSPSPQNFCNVESESNILFKNESKTILNLQCSYKIVMCQIFWLVKSNFCGIKSKSESTKLFVQRVWVRVLQKSPSPFCEPKSRLDPSLAHQPDIKCSFILLPTPNHNWNIFASHFDSAYFMGVDKIHYAELNTASS